MLGTGERETVSDSKMKIPHTPVNIVYPTLCVRFSHIYNEIKVRLRFVKYRFSSKRTEGSAVQYTGRQGRRFQTRHVVA